MISLKDVIKKISFAEYMTISFVVCVGMSLFHKYGFYAAIGVDWFPSLLTPQYLLISFVSYLVPTLIGVLIGGYLGINFNNTNGYFIFVLVFCFIIILNPFVRLFYKYQSLITVGYFGLIATITLIDVYSRQEKYKHIEPTSFDKLMGFIPVFVVVSAMVMPYFYGLEQGKNIIQNKSNLNYAVLADKTIWRIVESSNDKILLLSDKEKNTFKIVEYKDIDKIITK